MADSVLTDRERHVMRHALGLNISDTPYRNYYAASSGAIPVWEGLVARGLADRSEDSRPNRWQIYGVTDAGRAALKNDGGKS